VKVVFLLLNEDRYEWSRINVSVYEEMVTVNQILGEKNESEE
jgi:hypothetical protein